MTSCVPGQPAGLHRWSRRRRQAANGYLRWLFCARDRRWLRPVGGVHSLRVTITMTPMGRSRSSRATAAWH